MCSWLKSHSQPDNLKRKCTNTTHLSCLLFVSSPLSQVESFGNFISSSELLLCYPRNARQWSDRPGRSSAAVRLTPSDVLFVVLSSRSAWIHEQRPDLTFQPVKTCQTSREVSRILHLSGHWHRVTAWLSEMELWIIAWGRKIWSCLEMWRLQLDWFPNSHVAEEGCYGWNSWTYPALPCPAMAQCPMTV